MDFDRENPSPMARLPGSGEANWHDWSPELETAYLQHLAGVERLEDATSLQLVVNTSAGGSVAHLGSTLPNLLELNLNGSSLDSLRDLGTSFRLLQVLWVSRCGLKALDGLNGLPSLRELYAAYNDITDLQPVDCCQQLEVLDVECNCIPDTDAVLYLTCCTNLQTLTLAGNPAAEKHGYRQAVCGTLPSLRCLDDEPVTVADRSPPPQRGREAAAAAAAAAAAGGHRQSSVGGLLLSPSRRAVAVAATSASAGAPPSPSAGGADADELAFVVAGIKHARVGLDSHEFREIEMNLLVATADGTEVQLDARPGTSVLLPASASTWVRTLRSSREGSLAALRASAAAAAAAGRTGSQSPASPCSASPISSRPPSSQQQRGSGHVLVAATAAAAAPAVVERWAVPAGPGAGFGLSSSCGAPAGCGPWRPGSGTGVLMSGGGGAAGGMGGAVDSPMRPGSGSCRLGTGRPFSARPGTAASFSARIGTSASTGAAPASSSVGLYWAKHRINGTSGAGAAASGAADGPGGAAADADAVDGSSKLTLGSDTTFGGSFARDLRKWKGAAVRAAAAASAGGAGANGTVATAATAAAAAAAVACGTNGLSSTLLRGDQLDTKALLEELKRWKLETADKVLFIDPDETASVDGWASSEGPDRLAGAGAATAADILRITSSQDGAPAPEMAMGLGFALLDVQGASGGGGGGADVGGVPGSPLQPPRPPPGAAAAGRRKMVLAKVLRDIAADTIVGSGVCISDILKGLRPVHAPPAYSSGGGHHTPGIAWGDPGPADTLNSRARNRERDRDRDPDRDRSGTSAPTTSHSHHHHHQHQHHASKASQSQQQPQQQHAGTAVRPGSSISVCSSSGCSDYGTSGGAGGCLSRPQSRGDPPASTSTGGAPGGGSSGGGAQLQRQRSSRAPGLPAGPSAPATAGGGYRAVADADVHTPSANPPFRVGGWG